MKKVFPYQFLTTPTTPASSINVTVYGKSFLQTRNLYISGSNEGMFEQITYFRPFSSNSRMNAMYPAFSAVLIPTYTIESDKILRFAFSETPKTSGYVDIIIENEAGYGKLTIDSRTPFISSYNGATDTQNPWVNGIFFEVYDETLFYLLTDSNEPLYTEDDINILI